MLIQTELTKVATLDFDLNHVPLKDFVRIKAPDKLGVYYVATIKLQLKLDQDSLQAKMFWKNEKLTIIDLPY